MAQTVKDGTFVSSDLGRLFDDIINTNPKLSQRIVDVKNETNLFLCKVLRYYTYKDLALVKVLNDGSEILCHLTHDVLSRDVSIKSMNSGVVKTDESNGTYIVPHSNIYGIVAKVRWNGITDENCFISCVNINNNDELKSIVGDGEIVLTANNSKISLTNERINVMTPKLFINGLPYDAPELTNYYNKDEANLIQNNNDIQFQDLNNKIDDLDIEEITEEVNTLKDELEDIDFTKYMKKSEYTADLNNAKELNAESEFRSALDNVIVAMTGRGDNF